MINVTYPAMAHRGIFTQRSLDYINLVKWIVMICCFAKESGATPSMQMEALLLNDLLINYETMSRPVIRSNTTVNIELGITLNQIIDLDERNQILSTSLWITEAWQDEKLVWNPAHYNGMEQLIVPPSRIWMPDIFIFNTASGHADGFVNLTYSRVLVHYNGSVRWFVPLIINTSCTLDVQYFPYDKQNCTVYFGSWIYDGEQVNLFAASDVPDMSEYVSNGEFNLTATKVEKLNPQGFQYSGNKTKPLIKLELCIRRRSLYYDLTIVTPTVLMCALTLVIYLLPCHQGERIAIGLTVVLTLYFLQILVAENMPESDTPPLLGVLLLLVMTMNCSSLVMATVVMNIRKRAERKTYRKVPAWMLCLSRWCTRHDYLALRNKRQSMDISHVHGIHADPGSCGQEDEEVRYELTDMDFMNTTGGVVSLSSEDITSDEFPSTSNTSPQNTVNSETVHNNHGHNDDTTSSSDDDGDDNTDDVDFDISQRKIYTRLKTEEHSKQTTPRSDAGVSRTSLPCQLATRGSSIKQNWYLVSEALDRVSFCLSLVSMLTILIVFLFVLPSVDA